MLPSCPIGHRRSPGSLRNGAHSDFRPPRAGSSLPRAIPDPPAEDIAALATFLPAPSRTLAQAAATKALIRALAEHADGVLAQRATINILADADDAVDYLFTHPPFGSNLFYRDSSETRHPRNVRRSAHEGHSDLL